MAEANAQLESNQLQLREAENAKEAIKAQIESMRRPAGGNVAVQSLMLESTINVATPELDGRIDGLKRNLDALLQRYTEQHPDVTAARRLVADLEQQRKKELVELRRAALTTALAQGSGQVDASPAVQELQRMLAGAEVQVATMRTRVAEFGMRLGAARESLKTAPALEAEAAQLNRDAAVIRRNYEDLVSRRQSAVMSGELEVASGVADFRLIDPPRVSPRPVSPNRLAMLPLALLAGLGAGLSLAFVMSQLRPAFFDPADLRLKTGLPLLGVVSVRKDEAIRKRDRGSLMRFIAATGGLIAAFGVGLAAVAAFSA